ncbi:MAG: DUF4070 domain-containing protein [Lentisphaerales bacterium]|nr:DUF4070 domain-containing protein [Lentisphaerales bacterium]
MELRNNWKLKRTDSYIENIKRIQSAGIRVNACFIVGLDEHDHSIFDEIYQFAKTTCVYDIQVTLPTPFPGTKLYERLLLEGRLLEDKAWQKCTLFDILFQPKNFTVDELRNRFRELVKKLYSEDFTSKRRKYFHKLLKKQTVPPPA